MKKFFVIFTISILTMIWSSAWAADVKIEEIKPVTILLIKGKTSLEAIGSDIEKMFGELYGYLGEKKIKPAGPPMSIYYTPAGPNWEIAAGVTVAEGTPGMGKVEYQELAGGTMASLTHIGPYEKLGDAWKELSDWMEKNGYKPTGPSREVYVKAAPMEKDPAKFETMLMWPVAK